MSNSNSANKWAPLSYPSSSIFMASRPQASVPKKSERHANPYFPLHHDVLCAALRELLLLDGTIDARTLRIRDASTGGGIKMDVRDTSRPNSVDVVPLEETKKNTSLGRFGCAEELVESIVRRAVDKRADINEQQVLEHVYNPEKEVSMCESRPMPNNPMDQDLLGVSSKRKVSDADDACIDTKRFRRDNSFPSHVLQIVRSNVVVLQRPSPNSAHEEATNDLATDDLSAPSNFATSLSVSDDELLDFLRFPQLQKQQSANKQTTLFALPHLLKTSIADESQLREVAHKMSLSIFVTYDLEAPLRIFLGYKSNKSVDRNKLVTIFSDILFDVSHAMYAWVQTEKEMTASNVGGMKDSSTKKGKRVQIPTASLNASDVESIIKDSLFDERALKRIGGFEPTSLLPLALGIRHCILNHMTWVEYASTIDGKRAMEFHLRSNDDKMKKRRSSELFEIGKQRRGRRGRALRMGRVDDASYVVG
jgi:hypothetical protein